MQMTDEHFFKQEESIIAEKKQELMALENSLKDLYARWEDLELKH